MPTTSLTENRGVDDWEGIIPFYSGDCDMQLQADGGRIARQYLVPWDRRQSVAQQFIGFPYIAGNGEMRRHLPERIETITDDFDEGFMYCDSVRMVPLGGGGDKDDDEFYANIPQPYRKWDYALMTVGYVTRPYDVLTIDEINDFYGADTIPTEMGRFITWDDDESVSFVTAEHGNWVFKDSGKPVGNKVAFPLPQGELTLTWWDVHPMAFLVGNARGLEGKTNDDQFFSYPKETLIFTGFKRRRRRSPLGQRLFNIQFKFLYRPLGANKFLKPSGDDVEEIVDNATRERKPIGSGDFDALFEVVGA